jgi:hypothetical protein
MLLRFARAIEVGGFCYAQDETAQIADVVAVGLIKQGVAKPAKPGDGAVPGARTAPVEMRAVRFATDVSVNGTQYAKGEVAGFEVTMAERLLAAGQAIPHRPVAPEAQAKRA